MFQNLISEKPGKTYAQLAEYSKQWFETYFDELKITRKYIRDF